MCYSLGSRFFDRNDEKFNWIPINVYHSYNRNLNAYRHQIPTRLSYAITIHKSQGQTIDCCIKDLGIFVLNKIIIISNFLSFLK